MDILTETDTMDEVNRLEAEQCGSTSVQLVQLPTHSDTPGVSMMSNTGAVGQTSRIRDMWFHLSTAGSTTHTL